MEISKLKMDRNFSLNEKKSQNVNIKDSTKAKENISPYEKKVG